MPQEPRQPDPESKVDVTKRYDVYCNPHGQPSVVYRNVLFKRERSLFGRGDHFDRVGQFLELELPNGTPVFVGRMSVISFCEAGKDPGHEPAYPTSAK